MRGKVNDFENPPEVSDFERLSRLHLGQVARLPHFQEFLRTSTTLLAGLRQVRKEVAPQSVGGILAVVFA